MKKPALLAVIIGSIVALGGGAFAVTRGDSNSKESANSTPAAVMEKKDSVEDTTAMSKDDAVMQKTDETMVKEDAAMQKDDATAKSTETTMAKASTYVTLADFNKDPSIYASQRKVYFFHASWCPICQDIDKDIMSDPTQIPSGTTFIKTDYDANTTLRQKYGVTYQYTFVQVDNDGKELKQWSATSLDKAIAGIQ